MTRYSSTKIKFCGLKSRDDIMNAVSLPINYIGFVSYRHSPRHVEAQQVEELRDIYQASDVQSVWVTVNPSDSCLEELVSKTDPDFIQLHGNESVARVEEIKTRFGVSVIKAISVRSLDDIALARPYHDVAEFVLFDAKAPQNAVLPGGNGLAFNWQILFDVKLPKFWALSGGLHDKNVIKALTISSAPMVDVSSGIESAPGVKSLELMNEFVNAVRIYDTSS